jgi:pilus assembly protein CpaF
MAAPPRSMPSPSRVTLDELRRRAAARLAERLEANKSKHKPLSLVKAESKRILEQFLDAEAAAVPAAERERVVFEVLAEAVGLGPLEELFRDETIPEFMILGPSLIIARKGENWLPTSVRFSDAAHYARILGKIAEQGERTSPLSQPTGGLDVKLPNGFRVTAVVPPSLLEQPPLAVFLRLTPPKAAAVAVPAARAIPTEPSGTISFNQTVSPNANGSQTERLSGSVSASASQRITDPLERLRQRTLARLIERLAAAGVYDLSSMPKQELSKVVSVQLVETAAAEKLSADAATLERLTQEILAGMQR